MKKIIIFIFLSLILFYFALSKKEPKDLLAKFVISKADNDSIVLKFPSGLISHGDFLYSIVDSNIGRLQVFKISADGSLTPKFSVGKPGKNLGEFGTPLGLAVKDDYLFVADSGNGRLQVFKISADGSLTPKFSVGKPGKNLGEFGGDSAYLTMLAIKSKFLYVADTGNSRIQVFEIAY